jgi:hypothetical protein
MSMYCMLRCVLSAACCKLMLVKVCNTFVSWMLIQRTVRPFRPFSTTDAIHDMRLVRSSSFIPISYSLQMLLIIYC